MDYSTGISGSAVNGTRFAGSSHWKIPRKSGKSKKVGPFSRLEFPNGMSCSIYVSRSLYQFQVHGRAPPRTGVYDQMEQLFTNRKFYFCSHRNFRVFFLNGKRLRSNGFSPPQTQSTSKGRERSPSNRTNNPGGNLEQKHKTVRFDVVGEQPATKYPQISVPDLKD